MRGLRIPVPEAEFVLFVIIYNPSGQLRGHGAVEDQDMGIFLKKRGRVFLRRQTNFGSPFDGDEGGLIFQEQPPSCFNGERGVSLTVEHHILNRPAQDPAGFVDLLHRILLEVHAGFRPRGGDVADIANDDRLALRLGQSRGAGSQPQERKDRQENDSQLKPSFHCSPSLLVIF
jgi:hypothetical protein